MGLRQVSSSSLSPDLISRGIQPQNEPQAGLQPQIDSHLLQQHPQQRLVSEQSQLSKTRLGLPSSVQDHNLGKAQRPLQSEYLNGGEQNILSISQEPPHAQNKSSSPVSRPTTSSSLEEERHLPQQTTAQLVSRDELQHSGTIGSTDSRISTTTSTETPDLNSKHSAANFNVPTQKILDSLEPDQSAALLLSSDGRAAPQSKPILDAPRLPCPDVGGIFRGGWNDQRERTTAQVAEWQRSQSQSNAVTSNSMPHGAVDTKQPRIISQNKNLKQSHQVASQRNESFKDEPSPDQGALLTAQSSFLVEDHAQKTKHRPFSFMELSSHKTHEPVQEILQHVRRSGAKSSGDRFDRDPSPVSPQRSLHDQVIPVQRDSSDDFLPSEKQLELATQSSSYHFQDPNLHEHPAFRHEAPSVDNSSLRTDHVPEGTPGRVSAVQQQQSPPAVPPHGVIANSWRNPSSSAFPPALSTPKKAEESKPITGSGPSIAPKIKTKRASLFRSLNGRSGKDHDSGRDPRETTASPPATRTEPKKMSRHHENVKVDTRTSDSNKAHNKVQRSSSTAIPEQESGKKKRFSVLGVSLF